MGIDRIGQNQNATADQSSTFSQSLDTASDGIENNSDELSPTTNIATPLPWQMDGAVKAAKHVMEAVPVYKGNFSNPTPFYDLSTGVSGTSGGGNP